MTTWELWEKMEYVEWGTFHDFLEIVLEKEKEDNEEITTEELQRLYEASNFENYTASDTVDCLCGHYCYYDDLLAWYFKDLEHMHYVNDYAEEFRVCESGSFDIWKLLARAQAQFFTEQLEQINNILRDILRLVD